MTERRAYTAEGPLISHGFSSAFRITGFNMENKIKICTVRLVKFPKRCYHFQGVRVQFVRWGTSGRLPSTREPAQKMRLPHLRRKNALREALKILPAIGGLDIDIDIL